MTAATVALAAVAALAKALDSHPVAAAVLSVGVAFAGGLLVALGPWAALAGTQSTVLFLVFTASPIGGSWLEVGLAVLVGGALQAAVALVGWPWPAVRPRGARPPASLGGSRRLGEHPDDAHDRACVLARADASSVLALSSAKGDTGQRMRGLLDRADWLRLELVALGRRKDAGAQRLRAHAAEAISELSIALSCPADERVGSSILGGFRLPPGDRAGRHAPARPRRRREPRAP